MIMTAVSMTSGLGKLRGVINQVLVMILINIPSISFGLALGWTAVTSGEGHDSDEEGKDDERVRGAVVAAVTTFTASLVGVPLSALALARGRKFAIIATSATFVVCWALKLGGSWWGAGSWVAAGLGGAAVWAITPLVAKEMCSPVWQGAAVSALPLANSGGVLLMYLAADAAVPRRAVLWACLGLSLLHCVVSLLMPESPSYLASQGKLEEARKTLWWLRGENPTDEELRALPTCAETGGTAWRLVQDMLRDSRRRRAFCIGAAAVMGQEICGILAVLQYAERVFLLARPTGPVPTPESLTSTFEAVHTEGAVAAGEGLASPARHAVVLGAVQLVFSAVALYLVERVGRRPLLIWSSAITGGALAAAAALVYYSTGVGLESVDVGSMGLGSLGLGSVSWAGVALGVAVSADAAGMQPAPYALLADMFHYEYRGCALLLALVGTHAGNAIEVAVFPVITAYAGLAAALAIAATLTLTYTAFVIFAVPETRNRTPEQIYDEICPLKEADTETGIKFTNNAGNEIDTKQNTLKKDDDDDRSRGYINNGNNVHDECAEKSNQAIIYKSSTQNKVANQVGDRFGNEICNIISNQDIDKLNQNNCKIKSSSQNKENSNPKVSDMNSLADLKAKMSGNNNINGNTHKIFLKEANDKDEEIKDYLSKNIIISDIVKCRTNNDKCENETYTKNVTKLGFSNEKCVSDSKSNTKWYFTRL